MYSGGDLSKVQVQRKHPRLQEEAHQKQNSAPYLAANLPTLNYLARNNLNFQNLLLLHSIFSLGMDEPISKILNEAQKQNHNNDTGHASGRQRNHAKHQQQQQQHHFRPHHTIFDTQNKVHNNYCQQDVVMGYPAPDCPPTGPPPLQAPDHSTKWTAVNGNVAVNTGPFGMNGEHSFYTSSRDTSQWASSYNPSGDEADVRSGSYHLESCSNVEEGMSEGIEKKTNMNYSHPNTNTINNQHYHNNGHGDEAKYTLMRCKSWPDPLNSPSQSSEQEFEESKESGFQLPDGEMVEYPSFMKNEEDIYCMEEKSDLERFIDAATPSIFGDSKSQLTMDDIWEFYQIPSVYGLQVPFFKGSKGVSLAHFVPSLSAIRLFVPTSPVQTEEEASSSKELYLCDMPGCPRFLKLTFEFFEELVPHVRPPFSTRLREFRKMGSPDFQIPNLPLRDIHPASWFAVAWYPVYCIPEGKLRTSFLTFHSFGRPQQTINSVAAMQKIDSCTKAPLIGIKFLSLSKDAWIRSGRRSKIEIAAPSLPVVPSSDHEESDRSHDRVLSAHSTSSPKSIVSIKNGMSIYQTERRSNQNQKELENRVENLQSKAEILARASYLQVMCGSGKRVEPASCWHFDFEFFHQRG